MASLTARSEHAVDALPSALSPDVAPLRQGDISFILTVVLNAMSPPASKTAPVTAQTLKTVSDMRTGSLTGGSHTDSKKQSAVKVPKSLYQVSFLGELERNTAWMYNLVGLGGNDVCDPSAALKILMVCFERELSPDWPRMARVLRDQVRHKEAGSVFWNFLDFVVTQRTPLFVLLLPFIGQKVSTTTSPLPASRKWGTCPAKGLRQGLHG